VPEYGQMWSVCAWILTLLGQDSTRVVASYRSKNHGHRGLLSIVSQKIVPRVELSSTFRAQCKQSDLSERSNLRIRPTNKLALLSEGVECVCYERRPRERDPMWSTPRIDFSTLARALAVCAFTVPMGTPRTRAVSQTES